MQTLLILMAQFGPRVAIPAEEVRRAYFPHLDWGLFLSRIQQGTIRLPIVRADKSRGTSRFISMADLALYLDTQMETGRNDYQQMLTAAEKRDARKPTLSNHTLPGLTP
ncbi:pyocin activator PrtN family protein [Paraburkholderia agricolaris]|uniref:pyocin activator PrtN family protein n=1 Tax=Paraburkholderia agricolaris TaxID=2152888 RepID=UPI0038BAC00E